VGLGEALAALNQVVTARTNALSEADNAAYRTAMGDETTSAYNFSRSVPLNIRTKYAARVQGVTSSTASSAEKVRQADIIEADARTSGLELRERAQVVARTLPAAVRDTFLEEMTTLIDTTVNEMIITKFALIRERAENEAKTSDALANTTADRDAGQAVRSDLANLEQEQIELARDRAQQDRLSARNEEEWFLAEGRYRAAMTELRRRSVEQAEASLQNESYYDEDSTHIRPHDGPTTSVRGMRPHPVTGVRRMHDGIDIDGESGDSIRAAASGIARVKSDPRGYGNYIEVTNDDGTKSLYAHLRKVNVANEGRVERGQVIGEMGGGANDPGRGSSTGSHLHYEVRNADGVLINPEGYRGTPGGGSQGRADFDRLRQLRISNAAAEADNQQMADDRAATAVLRDLKFKPERTRMLGETRTNNARIKALIDGLRDGGDETAVLDTVVSEVRALVQQNFINAAKLIADDPKNSERVGTEGYEDEIVSAQIQVMLKGADDLDKAYESYREVQNRITEESLAFVNRELAVAGATAGTSETTVFMLEQRQQLEEYLAAQRELLANQVIYTDSVVALALAEQELANATLAVVAAQDEAALSQARIRLATATEGLGAAKQSKNAAQVQMGVSQLNVNATKPLVPLAPGAATATAAGRDWMTDPKSALDDVIAKFKNASGIMAGMSQTISQGIQGSFDALTQGINDSIMQLGDGTLTIQGLFSNLLGGILKEMQQTAAKIATNWIMQWIVRTVMGSMMPSAPGFNMDAQGMSMLNRKHGGMTPGTPKRFALGGGTGQAGRDSVHGLLEPGEITMRKSAVDFIGKDKLLEMNALGNRRLSEATSKVPMMTPREPDQVNVWLATPGQVPPPSKKDIVLMVGESMTNGELKRLVKQVAVGG
jgi:murein DD-endopeptidase MepM/ murein hydrolase activator NlpD